MAAAGSETRAERGRQLSVPRTEDKATDILPGHSHRALTRTLRRVAGPVKCNTLLTDTTQPPTFHHVDQPSFCTNARKGICVTTQAIIIRSPPQNKALTTDTTAHNIAVLSTQ